MKNCPIAKALIAIAKALRGLHAWETKHTRAAFTHTHAQRRRRTDSARAVSTGTADRTDSTRGRADVVPTWPVIMLPMKSKTDRLASVRTPNCSTQLNSQLKCSTLNSQLLNSTAQPATLNSTAQLSTAVQVYRPLHLFRHRLVVGISASEGAFFRGSESEGE
jgi:hypothetical protein